MVNDAEDSVHLKEETKVKEWVEDECDPSAERKRHWDRKGCI